LQISTSLKIGFSPTLGYARVQAEVSELVEKAASSFEQMGHRVEEWQGRLPDVSETWSELFSSDIYAQIQHELPRTRPQPGRSLLKSLDQASRLSLEALIKHQKIRSDLNRILWQFFNRFDILLTPTMPTEAFRAEGPPPKEIDGHPIPLLGAVAFTYPFNLSGHPAASVRAGITRAGLPAGLQIIGPRHRDDLVLQTAFAYGQAHPWDDDWPQL